MSKTSNIAEGPRLQVRITNHTAGWLQRAADERGVGLPEVARQYIEDSLYLFHVPPSLYARFQQEATRRRLPLSSLMLDLLTELATTLPAAPPDLVIPQNLAPQSSKDAAPKKRAK